MSNIERLFEINPDYNEKNILKRRTLIFSAEIVKLSTEINEKYKTYALTQQLLRSVTSIGANSSEAEKGVSRADFENKLGIAHKEAAESIYWLSLFFASGYLDENEYLRYWEAANELQKIISSSIITSQKTKTKNNIL